MFFKHVLETTTATSTVTVFLAERWTTLPCIGSSFSVEIALAISIYTNVPMGIVVSKEEYNQKCTRAFDMVFDWETLLRISFDCQSKNDVIGFIFPRRERIPFDSWRYIQKIDENTLELVQI